MERNTTERFFIVKENTPFFRQFVAYEEFVDKSCKVFSWVLFRWERMLKPLDLAS